MMQNKPYGFIYKTIFPDGRFYLGQHKIISHSTLDSSYFGSGRIIKDYIKSKGKTELKREILKFGYSYDEMNTLESIFITEEILLDPLCVNLDIGGKNKFSRYSEVNKRISQTMSVLRKAYPNKWPSRKGKDNNKSKKWKLISPSNEEFFIEGGLASFCAEMKISVNTIKSAIKHGYIPRRGSCKGWQAFDLSSGKGTIRETRNRGESIKGDNNPYKKFLLKRRKE
jgi:hypothetical protein